MSRVAQEHRPDLDDLILNCLERRTFVEFGHLAEEIDTICTESGNHKVSPSTLHSNLKRLEKSGKIIHQRAGYSIDRGWKEGQPKAFIFITSIRPKKRGEHCQKKLADQLRESFRKGEYEGVNLISIDIVTGAAYDVIAQVYSNDLHFIGKFVMDTLRANELVTDTHTIMVWPTSPQAESPQRNVEADDAAPE
jgi:DNA-binding Lrp family transcriptional regulator